MTMIGLELNDVGILAAASHPAKLLELDGQATESPGFALLQKDHLTVGKEAENKAHLFPRQILNRFWDQLNTEALEQTGTFAPQNHAEIAYSHLARIWEHIRKDRDEIAIAVPSFFDREQLGLLLGIAQELTMPVRGFIPLALAASSTACPEKMLLHLDIHLHRIEVSYLQQGIHLKIEDSETVINKGLIHLYKEWVELIAREFVRTTRFDPYHQAVSEQELYDRLPAVLSDLQHNPSMAFEMTGSSGTYSVALTRNLIAQKGETVYGEIRQMVERLRAKYGKNNPALVLQLTHRLTRLPGCKELLAEIRDAEIIELNQGAGAYGLLEIWDQLPDQHSTDGIAFFTNRPWTYTPSQPDRVQAEVMPIGVCPTHLLYRSIAYPLSTNPLYIGREIESGKSGVRIQGQIGGVSRRHCSVELRGRDVVLKDFSTYGTFVDENRINGSAVLKLGQIIRVGTPGEELQLIACFDHDET